MSDAVFRAVQGKAYDRHWRIEKRAWWGWREVYDFYGSPEEAQATLNRFAKPLFLEPQILSPTVSAPEQQVKP